MRFSTAILRLAYAGSVLAVSSASVGQIADGQVQASGYVSTASSKAAVASSAAPAPTQASAAPKVPIQQIGDGQVQNIPTAAPVAPPIISIPAPPPPPVQSVSATPPAPVQPAPLPPPPAPPAASVSAPKPVAPVYTGGAVAMKVGGSGLGMLAAAIAFLG